MVALIHRRRRLVPSGGRARRPATGAVRIGPGRGLVPRSSRRGLGRVVAPGVRPLVWAWDAVSVFAGGRPWLGDRVAGVLYAVACLAEISATTRIAGHPYRALDLPAVLLVLAGAVALGVQRRCPRTSVVTTGALAILLPAVGYLTEPPFVGLGTTVPTLGFLIALYALSLRLGRAPSVPALAAAIPIGAATMLVYGQQYRFTGLPAVVLFCVIAWGFGDAQRSSRARAESLRARAERLEREQHALAEVAVAQERAGIARELHDVVAHHLSLMIVNAAAADRQLARDPEAARRVLGDLVVTGQAAVTEMRRLLTVLRQDDAYGDPLHDRHPQPTIDELDEMIETFRGAGLDVTLARPGSARPLSAGVDLTAYRILQESLTNALRHAGVGTRVEVCVEFGSDALVLDVRDGGPPRERPLPSGRMRSPGHGLIGMRERVNLVGGTLHAGQHPEGGFIVHATLPLPPIAAAPPPIAAERGPA